MVDAFIDMAGSPTASPGRHVAHSSSGCDVQDDIGQKLLEAQLIDENALVKAAQQQKSTGGIADRQPRQDRRDHRGRSARLPVAALLRARRSTCKNFEPDPALIKLLPGDVATKFMALPVSRSGRRLIVAMANPTNIFAIDDIKFITGYEVEPHVATEAAHQAGASTARTTRPARWPT